MKISQVLDEVKILIDRGNFSINAFDLRFGNRYIFDGSCFLIPDIEDSLCYDSHSKIILYLPNIYDNNFVVIDESDKSFMFNIMVQYDLSTDNIETFKNVVQLYKTVRYGHINT